MPKAPSGSGPPRRPRSRPAPRSKRAAEAMVSDKPPTSPTPAEEADADGMVIELLPGRPRKVARPRKYKPPAAPRFRIFIIDSGWNTVARRVLRHNFALLRRLRKEELIYLLSRKRSVEFIRRHRSLIGRDPIIAVHDLKAIELHGTARFHGFHLHLGILRTPGEALMALQTLAQFVSTRRHSENLEAEIRSELRREGMVGALEIFFHKVPRALGG